ncbi:MAG: histidine phosphatase family protein [Opitutaceae bacterium]
MQIPSSTLRLIEHAPRDRVVVLLLRHSAREDLPVDDVGNMLPITLGGREMACALGLALKGRLRALRTSPILRCVETAEVIQEGAESNLTIILDRCLGDPGVYVEDAELAWTNWQSMGNEGVMKHLISSSEALPGMARPADAAERIVDHMFKVSGNVPGLHVFVTHDAILAPTVAHVLGVPVGEANWPAFLEGAIFWKDAERLQSAYWDM